MQKECQKDRYFFPVAVVGYHQTVFPVATIKNISSKKHKLDVHQDFLIGIRKQTNLKPHGNHYTHPPRKKKRSTNPSKTGLWTQPTSYPPLPRCAFCCDSPTLKGSSQCLEKNQSVSSKFPWPFHHHAMFFFRRFRHFLLHLLPGLFFPKTLFDGCFETIPPNLKKEPNKMYRCVFSKALFPWEKPKTTQVFHRSDFPQKSLGIHRSKLPKQPQKTRQHQNQPWRYI